MSAYLPHDLDTIALVALILTGELLLGLVISQAQAFRHSVRLARVTAWLIVLGGTAGVERLCAGEPAGVRMLALIAALLFAMKAVVTVEAQAAGMPPLAVWKWLCFAAGWPGMRPGIFAAAGEPALPGAFSLIGRGCAWSGLGAALSVSAWMIEHANLVHLSDELACVVATVLLMVGLSLMLHFGAFNVLAGLWRLAGVDARALFRAPLASRSLAEFWGRRWNLAFSEMTAIGVYRPLSEVAGKRIATAGAFLASGVLHEVAISLPVLAGFGLPLLYFALHGVLVLVERRLEKRGWAVSNWKWASHIWVLGWLALPAPILFHLPFLRGVVWPLIGIR